MIFTFVIVTINVIVFGNQARGDALPKIVSYGIQSMSMYAYENSFMKALNACIKTFGKWA